MLNNREWAMLIWLGIFVLFVLSRRDLRRSLGDVLRTAAHPRILISFGTFIGFVALEAWIASKLGLWRPGLIKETVIWFLVAGVALFANFSAAWKEAHYYRRRILATFGITEFLTFFTNLYVLSLPWELALQPILLLLVGIATYAATSREHRAARRVADTILALIGITLLIVSLQQLITRWAEVKTDIVLLQLALPIWMTLGALPFIYLVSLYANYELAFKGVNWATDDRAARRRAKLAVVNVFHVRNRRLGQFTWSAAKQMASVPSIGAARRVIHEHLQKQQDAERAVAEEQERLRRYAGSDATDADGRRLDRREFKETIRALQWLATCQMGWYQNENHKGRYRVDLLDLFGDDFTMYDLPEDAGITMRVAKDGQAWYAWRRTVTGWCFAIGAAGPPPSQWEYDGPEPPRGFPGQDAAWGNSPLSCEASPNWRWSL